MKLTCLSAPHCKICIQINVLLGCGLWLYPHIALQEFLFSTNNVLHLQVMFIFLKQHSFFFCGLPVFSTEFALQSCFCNHSCIQKIFFCMKELLQQSNNQSFDTLYYCLEYQCVQRSKGKVKCKTFKTTSVHNIFNSNRETRR